MWTIFCWLLFSIAKEHDVKGKVGNKEDLPSFILISFFLIPSDWMFLSRSMEKRAWSPESFYQGKAQSKRTSQLAR